MPAYYLLWCEHCGWEGQRYRNVKKCPGCHSKGTLHRPHELHEPEGCPTCGKAFAWNAVRRICAKCGKQIKNGHKWRTVGSRLCHRLCEFPDHYIKPGDKR